MSRSGDSCVYSLVNLDIYLQMLRVFVGLQHFLLLIGVK